MTASTVLLAGLLATPHVGATPAEAAASRTPENCRGRVALTFDDGPSTSVTPRLLRILRGRHVPATFFMVGQRVAAAPRVARRAERAGFLLANHSWAHADMADQTAAAVTGSLRATDRALRAAGTHPTKLMRPPYGSLDDAARVGIRAAGFTPVLWTIDSRDWESGTAGDIANRILGALQPGQNIVLQHDGVARSPISIAAVGRVVDGARRRGYCFTALDESGRPGFPTPRLTARTTNAREGDTAKVVLSLSKPAGRATSVLLRTVSGTARSGSDFSLVRKRVTIPAGRLKTKIRIPLLPDRVDEPRESFGVEASRGRGVKIATSRLSITIRDDDPRPTVRGVDAEVVEPGADQATVEVAFRLSAASGRPITLQVRTVHIDTDDSDLVATTERIRIPAGEQQVTVPISVFADVLVEPDERFRVDIVGARHAKIGRSAHITIVDTPSPEPPDATS